MQKVMAAQFESFKDPFIIMIAKLEENGLEDYQIIEQVPAKNVRGAPRLNTAVWPSHNSSILLQLSDDQNARKILEVVRDFNHKAYNENERVTACSWTLDDYFFE
ncbi:MAG: hypothetical protein KGY60_03725 [Bacteroidales bacterium]|nr:hypothetical protein [Bacteroidales bacterium]